MQDALSTSGLKPPSSSLDADTCVRTITSILNGAAKAASPLPRKKKSKKGYPIWNDTVAAAVQMSKKAHYEWKRAGRPRGESSSFRNRKEARKYMRQVLRMTLCQQNQELMTEIMTAKDTDVKLFHRLIKRQRTIPNTVTQVLIYNGETLSCADDIADGFASHFQSLATPSNNENFDKEYFSQVEADMAVIEEICAKTEGSLEPTPVTAKEIRNIIRSFKNGKAQDIHGLTAEHLKHAMDEVCQPLADLMNYILSCGYIPPMMLEGLVTPVPKKDKDATLPTIIGELRSCPLLGKCWKRYSRDVRKLSYLRTSPGCSAASRRSPHLSTQPS